MTKKNILLSLFILANLCLYSQISKEEYHYLESQIPKEKVQLHTNTNLLVTGEFLYYQITALNTETSTFSDISKITYVELIGADKKVLFKQKLKSDNGISFSEFFIPPTIKTGQYKLIAYTNWAKNNILDSFYEKDIYIINPFSNDHQLKPSTESDINSVEISKRDQELNDISKVSNNPISVSTNKSTYNSREKVTINIEKNKFNSYNGNYSLSVRKMDSVSVSKELKTSSVSKPPRNTYFLPELRGDIITGKLSADSADVSVSNKQVSLSIPGSDFLFKNSKTNASGEFYFVLSKDYTASNALLQVQESNYQDYNLHLNEEGFDEYTDFTFKSIKLNPNIRDWIKTRSIKNQIENAYLISKTDSISQNFIHEPFFNSLQTRFILDDFNRFPTIRETFTEIILTASISKKGDNYVFQVTDYKNFNINNILDSRPLVLCDGILIEDNNQIINYDADKIFSISTVSGIYIYGSKIYNGIISIATKKSDFSLSRNIEKVQLLKPVENKIYYQPDYLTDTLSRIPDYRTQLLWKPNLTLSNDASKELTFFTSDNHGLYEVVLEGYTTDGKHIKAINYFNVN
ncbi:hypothetical protein [Bizionia arctica]|uniref:Macroglobulin domain-containing protein n=1 Tax=Bizionia arctica TaxID=1495645 RepID=A0A917GHP8_9FLAO|nr:hypothetical protein [Bizionia arctica]GGG45747.1 hypothetical protein GCM10010976_16630 [Bizionia arctica]